MKLNCRAGQMAMVVKTPTLAGCYAHMLGVPVKVMAPSMPRDVADALTMVIDDTLLWRVETPVTCRKCGHMEPLFPDSILRPFDPDSEPKDEPVDVAKPVDTKAPATT